MAGIGPTPPRGRSSPPLGTASDIAALEAIRNELWDDAEGARESVDRLADLVGARTWALRDRPDTYDRMAALAHAEKLAGDLAAIGSKIGDAVHYIHGQLHADPRALGDAGQLIDECVARIRAFGRRAAPEK